MGGAKVSLPRKNYKTRPASVENPRKTKTKKNNGRVLRSIPWSPTVADAVRGVLPGIMLQQATHTSGGQMTLCLATADDLLIGPNLPRKTTTNLKFPSQRQQGLDGEDTGKPPRTIRGLDAREN